MLIGKVWSRVQRIFKHSRTYCVSLISMIPRPDSLARWYTAREWVPGKTLPTLPRAWPRKLSRGLRQTLFLGNVRAKTRSPNPTRPISEVFFKLTTILWNTACIMMICLDTCVSCFLFISVVLIKFALALTCKNKAFQIVRERCEKPQSVWSENGWTFLAKNIATKKKKSSTN